MEQTVDQALQQGVAAHNAGNLQEAERLYRTILQVQPKHPDANHNLALIAVSMNQSGTALPLFKTAVDVNPNIEQFWLSYIEALITERQFENVKRALKKGKKKGVAKDKLNTLMQKLASAKEGNIPIQAPPQPEIQRLLNYFQEGRYADAEKLATLLTQQFPEDPFSWKILGGVFRKLGRMSEALVASQKAVELDVQDPQAHNSYGLILEDLGRLEQAEQSYRQAIASKSDYAEAHYNLGNMLLELGSLEEAETSYMRVIALKPDFTEAHYNLGNTLRELGRLEEAETSYRQAIASKSHFAEAHNNLGTTLKELGSLKEAEASYRQAISFKSDYAEAHSNLGTTLKELGRLEQAEKSYRQAIASKSDYAEAHYNLGNMLLELGSLDEAETSYMRAIALKPDYAEAHANLAIVLNAMGLQESALQYFKRNLHLVRGENPVNAGHKNFSLISKAKIDHDIEQFEYLAASGYETKRFHELARLYKTVSSEINYPIDTYLVPLSDQHKNILRDTYNRPIHILEAPELEGSALGDNLNVSQITDDYFDHEFGLTYVDNFLSPNALQSLRKFLVGSTIWFDLFHKGGYLGAYLEDGLASPLVLQIAEELRTSFPKIFKNHFLTRLWAYKYDSRACEKNNSFSGINVHADFAAINVNFWVTPKSANLDPSSGGLVVYNAEAPLDWDFETYNNNEEKILEEIQKSDQKKTIVPYNENRAVLFNSNLFHETDKIEFKEGYGNRRINVTMLFGRRGA